MIFLKENKMIELMIDEVLTTGSKRTRERTNKKDKYKETDTKTH